MSERANSLTTKLPVCLLTGFLGAGKSTTLNFVLRHPEMSGTAVVINEYGSVGVDHHLVESAPDETELIADGCLCCTASGRLVDALMALLERAAQNQFTLKRVVIETTGLAEPAPILQQLLYDPKLVEHFVVDSVVTLVDACNASATLAEHDIAVQQITGADRLLLTKTDLADEASTIALEKTLAAMNLDATIERLMKGAAQPAQLFSGAHHRTTTGEAIGNLFQNADQIRFTPTPAVSGRLLVPPLHEDQGIQTFSLILDEPLSASRFHGWMSFLRTLCGPSLLRVKGLVNLQGMPTVVHGVQRVFHTTQTLPSWPDDDQRTRLVFITRGWGRDMVGSTLDWLRVQDSTPSG